MGVLSKVMEASSSAARETMVHLEKKRKTDRMCAEVENVYQSGVTCQWVSI